MPIDWPFRRQAVAPANIPAELVFQLLDIQETVVNDWRHSKNEFLGFPDPVHDQLASNLLYQEGSRSTEDSDDNLAKLTWKPEECRLLLFGVDEKGQSICCQVRYYPYIYVEVPKEWDRPAQIRFIDSLAQKQRSLQGIKFTTEQKHHLSGWQSGDRPEIRRLNQYMKLRFTSYSQQMQCIKQLKDKYPVWEADRTLKLPLKFIDDMKLVAAGWVKVTKHVEPEHGYCSSCQIEVQAQSMGHVKAVVPEILKTAPLLIASVDIEAYSAARRFPDPANKKDYAIGIGVSVARLGDEANSEGFYLAFVPGSGETRISKMAEKETLITFGKERDLIEGYRDFLVLMDPDIVTGYNINRFDWKYLAGRVPPNSRFFRQSRIVMRETPLEKFSISSAAFGQNFEHHINMPGRIIMDMMTIIKRNPAFRLRDYKLNTVSAHFLKDTKVDLSAQEMFDCFEKGETEKIGTYCIQDTRLPLRLMKHLMTVTNTIEMGRLTSTFPNEVILRGQQQKITNFFYREAHKENFVFTIFSDTKVPDYEGATVIEPTVGFYDGIVVTLDYSSLYPSILIDNNLSHDTYLGTDNAGNVPDARKIGTDYFVKHQEGLLTKMERQLLAERKNVKKRMKAEKDPDLKNVLDAMQNSIKIVSNSIYGFTGSNTNIHNCPAVARCITNIGREMIMVTKSLIESTYKAKIIYGDTDSVFILFLDAKTPEDAFRLGKEAAEMVTKHFGGQVIQLIMEKIMTPFLLLAKKRYAGIKFEGIDEKGDLYCRGLETVRRDVSPFVGKTYKAALDAIIMKKDIMLAQQVVHQRLCDLEDGKIPFEEFEKSVQLKSDYKSENLPQLVVVEKMKKRNPGSEPISGDRFSYVLIDIGPGDHGVAAKAEDPVYAKEHNLPIDYLAYLEALKTPISNLFEAFTDDCSLIFRRTETLLQARQQHVNDISKFITGAASLETQERKMPVLPPKSAPKPVLRQRDLSEMLGGVSPPAPPAKKAKKKKGAAAEVPQTRNLNFFLRS